MDLSVRTATFGSEDHSWLGSARGTDSPRSVTLAIGAFTALTHFPDGYLKSGTALAVPTSGTYAGKAVPVAARPTEAQTVTITGAPTGGTVTLTLDGETTAAIAYNATASTVQTALEGLSNVSSGDVVVSGGPGPATAWVVTFGPGSRWAGLNVPQMTAASSLTGGTSPAIAVTTTTAGGSGVTDGSDVLAGFLYATQRIVDPFAGVTSTLVVAPLLDTGRIVEAKLPFAVSAAVKATNPRFTFI